MPRIPAWLRVSLPSLRPSAETRIPPVFIIGVAALLIVVGGLVLRSVVAGGDGSGLAAGPTSSGTPAAQPPAIATSPSPSATPARSQPTEPPPSATPAYGLLGYVWPLDGAKITLPFGPSPWGEFFVNGKRFHDGVDMATQCGDKVRAAHDGVVLAASRRYDEYMGWRGDITPYYNLLDRKGWWNSLPIVIVIDDGDGYYSIYAHESKVTVSPGQHVTAGQVIGYEGATGNTSGCHVHFGLFTWADPDNFQLDPGVVKRNLMPAEEVARINPLLVLPFRCDVSEMAALRPADAAACPGATPKPTARATPKPTATPRPSPAASPTPSGSAAPSEAPTGSPSS